MHTPFVADKLNYYNPQLMQRKIFISSQKYFIIKQKEEILHSNVIQTFSQAE